jgi:predicted DNA-binding ribbon-helix-helix protein
VKSPVVKRSVVIDGHKTSVSLEDPFWNDLKEIAHSQRVTLSKVIGEIDKGREHSNLSSALRLFVLDQVRMQRAARGLAGISRAELTGEPSN